MVMKVRKFYELYSKYIQTKCGEGDGGERLW